MMAGVGTGLMVSQIKVRQAGAQLINTASPTPILIYKPRWLEINKIGVKADIEEVGKNDLGEMEVPQDSQNVAWYSLGAKPGELGSAVVAGHLDDKSGPAIFYQLEKLEPRDKIKVVDERGKEYLFEVMAKKTYHTSDFPLKQVFANKDGYYLNLITCQGRFVAKKGYQDRLVVFSRLVEI